MRYIRKFDLSYINERLGINKDAESISDYIHNELKFDSSISVSLEKYPELYKIAKTLEVILNEKSESSYCTRKSNDVVQIVVSKNIYSIILHEVTHMFTVKSIEQVNKKTKTYNAKYTNNIFPHSYCLLYDLLYLTFGEEINSRVAETYVSLLTIATTKKNFSVNLGVSSIYAMMLKTKSIIEELEAQFQEHKTEFKRFVYYYNISAKNIKGGIVGDNTLTWKNILNSVLSKFKIVKPYDEASDEEVLKFIRKLKPLMKARIDKYFQKVYKMYDLFEDVVKHKEVLDKEDYIHNLKSLIPYVSGSESKLLLNQLIQKAQ